MTSVPAPLRRPAVAIDDDHFDLDATERAFFRAQTGIHNDDELKAHIKKIQAEAYEVRLSSECFYYQFSYIIFCPLLPSVGRSKTLISSIVDRHFAVASLPMYRPLSLYEVGSCLFVTQLTKGPLMKSLVCRNRSRISSLLAYEQLLRIGRDREDAIYLEMGCCCKYITTVTITAPLS